MSAGGSPGPDNGPVLAAAAVFLGGLAGTLWVGAQAAAVVFGAHRPARAGLRDTLAALPALLADPAHPAQAWPAPVAAVLPGPAGYWAATLPALAGYLLAAALAARLLAARPGVARRRRLGLDPEAHLARLWQLAPLWVTGPTRGRLVLGHARWGPLSRLLATEDAARPLDACVPRLLLRAGAERRRGDRGAVVVFGPSRCGKTAALAIPAILEWDGPLVALSVKTDLMGATLARRARLGEVRVFDPTGITGTTTGAAGWSPLAGAARLAGARRAARSLANATDWTSGGSGDMAFWNSAGEDLLGLLFFAAAQAGLGMDSVVAWVTGTDRDTVTALLAAFAAHTDPDTAAEGQQAHAAFTAVWRTDAKQVSSVYLVARAMIRPWQEPGVAASARTTTVDLAWLLGTTSDAGETGDAGDTGDTGYVRLAANSLFLCADLDDADRLAPVLGGLVDDLLRSAYAHVAATGCPLDPPLLVVIDEAGNWPMRNLPGRVSTCAGMGIQLLLAYQSKAQVDAAYGTKADIVVSNTTTKIFFSGLSDKATLDYAAGLLGSEHVPARTVSTDAAAGGGRRGVSDAPTRLDLLPAALLRQVRPGQALLVHHTLPPAHLHGRYWFRDPALRALAAGTTAAPLPRQPRWPTWGTWPDWPTWLRSPTRPGWVSWPRWMASLRPPTRWPQPDTAHGHGDNDASAAYDAGDGAPPPPAGHHGPGNSAVYDTDPSPVRIRTAGGWWRFYRTPGPGAGGPAWFGADLFDGGEATHPAAHLAAATAWELETQAGFALPAAAHHALHQAAPAAPHGSRAPAAAPPPPPDPTWRPDRCDHTTIAGHPAATYGQLLHEDPPLRSWAYRASQLDIASATPARDSAGTARLALAYRLSHHGTVVFAGDDIGMPADGDPASDDTVRNAVDLLTHPDPGARLTAAQQDFLDTAAEDLAAAAQPYGHPYPTGLRVTVELAAGPATTGTITGAIPGPGHTPAAYTWRPDLAGLPGHPWQRQPQLVLASPASQVRPTLAAPDRAADAADVLTYGAKVRTIDDPDIDTGTVTRAFPTGSSWVYEVEPDDPAIPPAPFDAADVVPTAGTAWPDIPTLLTARQHAHLPLEDGEILVTTRQAAHVHVDCFGQARLLDPQPRHPAHPLLDPARHLPGALAHPPATGPPPPAASLGPGL